MIVVKKILWAALKLVHLILEKNPRNLTSAETDPLDCDPCRPTDEEAEQLLQLMTSRPPATPAGVRFVSLSFCMLLAFPTLVRWAHQAPHSGQQTLKSLTFNCRLCLRNRLFFWWIAEREFGCWYVFIKSIFKWKWWSLICTHSRTRN